ncbi:MAG: hypothetical protein O3B42_05380, partial [Actinomycetota bacterium]|nr:hypothetical protein [Actinomycetota bacterium]
EGVCPPFKGDGRVRDERCRGMTLWCPAIPRVPPTILARKARPSSLKGGPPEKNGLPLFRSVKERSD